jgi:hypothetical protein
MLDPMGRMGRRKTWTNRGAMRILRVAQGVLRATVATASSGQPFQRL